MKRPAVNEIIHDPAAPFQALRASIKSEMHCSMPGIVHSFDPVTQTATIQPAIRSRVAAETGVQNVQLPLLANVPVFFPGGGEFALTMPIQPGDECLVVFADSCIDAWWQSGGVQNQIDMRSHDISDGFAFVGFRSRGKALQDFPTEGPSLIGSTLGEPGPAGKSAYELWLEAGHTGTVEDYLDSLIGPPGQDGQDGQDGGPGPAGPPGSDATVTRDAVEGVLTGAITSHVHTPQHIGAAPVTHGHTKAQITDFAHAHTPAEIGSVNKAGDTMTGFLQINTNGKYYAIGCQNASYAHHNTDATYGHWFNKDVRVQGEIYAGAAYNQQVYHKGNVGKGTGNPSGGVDGDLYIKYA